MKLEDGETIIDRIVRYVFYIAVVFALVMTVRLVIATHNLNVTIEWLRTHPGVKYDRQD